MKKLIFIFVLILTGCSGKPQRGVTSLEVKEGVFFRDKNLTFNKINEFKIEKGRIFYRRAGSKEWKIIPNPFGSKKIVQIGVDSDQMVVVDEGRRVFWNREAFSRNFSIASFSSNWGAPLGNGPGIKLPRDTKAWDFSFLSPKEDVYYTDESGNRHFIGVGVTTLYALRNQGQWITYLDPWLPADYSYEVCGPVRGRFQADSISASGSVLFVMNKYGDMYTRTYDFDINGGDNLFFWYTYDKEESRRTGTHRDKGLPPFYESLFNRRLISVTGWKTQPKINGTITDRISIIKTSEGGQSRLLRVEGIDANGKSGFFQKSIFEGKWKFIATGQKVKGNKIKNTKESSAHLTLGSDDSRAYILSGRGYSIKIQNFHPYCSPADVRVKFTNGRLLKLKLHTRERIRLDTRLRGVSNQELVLDGALEIPRGELERLPLMPVNVRRFVSRNLKNKRYTNIQIKVTNSRLSMYPNMEAKVKDIMADAGRDPLSNLNPLVHLERIRNLSTVEFMWRFRGI
jgi:hypothetical protein